MTRPTTQESLWRQSYSSNPQSYLESGDPQDPQHPENPGKKNNHQQQPTQKEGTNSSEKETLKAKKLSRLPIKIPFPKLTPLG